MREHIHGDDSLRIVFVLSNELAIRSTTKAIGSFVKDGGTKACVSWIQGLDPK